MKYNLIKITDEKIKKAQWSGGTTSEIYIYPENGNYKEGNFKWRISSATVELMESTFTKLPGIYRYITTLSGELKLIHDGGEIISLRPYDIHEFSGSLDTKSLGKVKDFNLMLNGNTSGYMESIELEENLISSFNIREEFTGIFSIFIFSDLVEVEVKLDEESCNINVGETIIIHELNLEKLSKITVKSTSPCKIIFGVVYDTN